MHHKFASLSAPLPYLLVGKMSLCGLCPLTFTLGDLGLSKSTQAPSNRPGPWERAFGLEAGAQAPELGTLLTGHAKIRVRPGITPGPSACVPSIYLRAGEVGA